MCLEILGFLSYKHSKKKEIIFLIFSLLNI